MKRLKSLLIVCVAAFACVAIGSWPQSPEWSVDCSQSWQLGFSSDNNFVMVAEADNDEHLVRVHFYSAFDGLSERTREFPVQAGRIPKLVYRSRPDELVVCTFPSGKWKYDRDKEEKEIFDLSTGHRRCPAIADSSSQFLWGLSPTAKYTVLKTIVDDEHGFRVRETRTGKELFVIQREDSQIDGVYLIADDCIVNEAEDKLLVVMLAVGQVGGGVVRIYELPGTKLISEKWIPKGANSFVAVRAWHGDVLEVDRYLPPGNRPPGNRNHPASFRQTFGVDLTSDDMLGTPIPGKLSYTYSANGNSDDQDYSTRHGQTWMTYTRTWKKRPPTWVTWVRQYEPRFLGFGWYNTKHRERWLADSTTGRRLWTMPGPNGYGKLSHDASMFVRKTSDDKLELYTTQTWPRWLGMVLIAICAVIIIRRTRKASPPATQNPVRKQNIGHV